MTYLICLIVTFVAIALAFAIMIIGWIRKKKIDAQELIFGLMWFALIMAIVTC